MQKRILLVTIIILIFNAVSIAQNEGDSTVIIHYNYKTGEKYHLVIKGGFDPTGVIISQDSLTIKLKTEYNSFTINKSDIIKVDDEDIVYKVWKDNRLTDTTSVCDVYVKQNHIYKGVKIIQLRDSFLTVLKGNHSKEININEIQKIAFWKTAWVNGVFDGLLAGLVAGFIFGYAIGQEGGHPNFGRGGYGLIFAVLFSVPGAIIGGIIGGITGFTYDYNLKKYDLKNKIIILKTLIDEYRISYY